MNKKGISRGRFPLRWFCVFLSFAFFLYFIPEGRAQTDTPTAFGTISYVDPPIFPADGIDHTITISGSGFDVTTGVFVDEAAVSSTFINSETLTIVRNYTSSGVHTIDVRTTFGQFSSTWEEGLFAIKSGELVAYPSYGTDDGGSTIQIYGLNGSIEAGATVYFDTSNNCGLLNPSGTSAFLTDNQMEAVTPSAGSPGFASVYVDNPNLPDLCSTNAFNYAGDHFAEDVLGVDPIFGTAS